MGTGAYAASAGGSSASLSSSSSSRSCVCGSRVASRGILPVERAHLLGWASFFSARLTPHSVTSAPRRTSLQRHITVLTSFSSSPRVMASRASLPQSHAAAHLLGWASFLSSRPKPHRSVACENSVLTLHATVTSSRRSRICAACSRLKPRRTESAVPA